MQYHVRITPRAERDYKSVPVQMRTKIFEKMMALEDNLKGDVKRLSAFKPPYRLRVGDYRVLFDIEGNDIIVYRVVNRRESYKKR